MPARRPSRRLRRPPRVPQFPPAATAEERTLMARLRTPRQVQQWLHGLPYNWEREGPTYRTLRGVVRTGTAHCGEAALAAATILEAHGRPPRVLVLDSVDGLGHVLTLYREQGRWGSIGKSRDPGLHGRKPRYRNLYTLARSYADPYVDLTGCLSGYAVFDLRNLPRRIPWRLGARNVFAFERVLNALPMRPLRVPPARVDRLRRAYREFLDRHPGHRPVDYPNRHLWQ